MTENVDYSVGVMVDPSLPPATIAIRPGKDGRSFGCPDAHEDEGIGYRVAVSLDIGIALQHGCLPEVARAVSRFAGALGQLASCSVPDAEYQGVVDSLHEALEEGAEDATRRVNAVIRATAALASIGRKG